MISLRKLDPFVLFLNCVLSGFFRGNLESHEKDFVCDNIQKHRKVQWVNAIATIFIVLALRDAKPEDFAVIITALLAPVVVLGGAWFQISFGAIPAKLIQVSMTITTWMFMAFLVSLTTMFIAVGFVTPPVAWPVLGLIYVGAVVSCIMYDTADGLKAGLDEAQLKHSRYAIQFYEEKQGISLKEGK